MNLIGYSNSNQQTLGQEIIKKGFDGTTFCTNARGQTNANVSTSVNGQFMWEFEIPGDMKIRVFKWKLGSQTWLGHTISLLYLYT